MVSMNGACGTTVHQAAVVLLARIEDDRGRPIVRADVPAVRYSIYAVELRSGVGTCGISDVGWALEVGDVVFDRVVSDQWWTEDDVGYKFRHEVASGDHVIRFGD